MMTVKITHIGGEVVPNESFRERLLRLRKQSGMTSRLWRMR